MVRIAGQRAYGIDSYGQPGTFLPKGEPSGMIRLGSRVNLVLSHLPEMEVRVRPGETVLLV